MRLQAMVFAATLASVPALAQDTEPVYAWSDDPPATYDLADWNPDIQDAPYFETWDFWMWADDGTFIFVQYLTSSFGFGIERNASGRMIVVEPGAVNSDGEGEGVWFGDRGWEWDAGDWNWTETPLDLTFRDCHLRGDGRVFELYMRGRQRTTYLDVTLTVEEPMFAHGDGRIEFGWERHYVYEQHVMPRFSFAGRLNRTTGRGGPENWEPIAGVGFGEHTLTNTFPFEVASEFQGFRALRSDGLSIVYDGFRTSHEHGDRQLGWLRVALDGQELLRTDDTSFVATDVRPYEGGASVYEIPYGYELRAEDGQDWVHVVVGNPELVSAESPYARIGSFLRAMLSAMMAPYDFELGVDYQAWIHVDGRTAYVAGRGWSTISFASAS